MQAVFVVERKGDGDLHPAGEALFAVGEHGGEFHAVLAAGIAPDLLVEAAQTAVELIFALVGGECIAAAVQAEGGPGDTVAVAADAGAEISAVDLVVGGPVIAEQHVGHRCTVRQQRDTHAVGVFQRDGGDGALGAGRGFLDGNHGELSFLRDEFQGSTARFGKQIRREIFRQAKI